MYYVGIDLGGTNIAVGVCNEQYEIIATASAKTNCPRPCEEICADMVKVTEEAVAKAGLTMDQIASIGIGAPGAINPDTKTIEFANNLGFKFAPVGEIMERLTGKEIYIENDANAAAYGEAVAGAAKGTRNSVTITLGTGVGGGVIIDGKVFSGFNHFGTRAGPHGDCARRAALLLRPRRLLGSVCIGQRADLSDENRDGGVIPNPSCGRWWTATSTASAAAPRSTRCVKATKPARRWSISTSAMWRAAWRI